MIEQMFDQRKRYRHRIGRLPCRVMGAASARFFDWIQTAGFYTDVHRAAVGLVTLPSSDAGCTWLDVGCGPGLVARLAAERLDAERRRGWVLGIDRDPAMVRAARRHRGSAQFDVGDAMSLAPASADVVSAASLLIGWTDPSEVVRSLWSAVRPGGSLLVVETTAAMTPDAARRVARSVPARHRSALRMWARARSGRTFDERPLELLAAARLERHRLLDGLVEAVVIGKP
jgi:ubiquinone/menaquinone biosynthesis C-methylase UbiE